MWIIMKKQRQCRDTTHNKNTGNTSFTQSVLFHWGHTPDHYCKCTKLMHECKGVFLKHNSIRFYPTNTHTISHRQSSMLWSVRTQAQAVHTQTAYAPRRRFWSPNHHDNALITTQLPWWHVKLQIFPPAGGLLASEPKVEACKPQTITGSWLRILPQLEQVFSLHVWERLTLPGVCLIISSSYEWFIAVLQMFHLSFQIRQPVIRERASSV